MAHSYDAIVIGAGVMGASTAMQLTDAGLKRVLVVEKAPGAGFGSTGKSSACIRQTYSHYETTLMAYESLQQFRRWQDFTGLQEPRADFRPSAVLFLCVPGDPSPEQALAHQRRVGVRSGMLDAQTCRELYPDLDHCATPVDLEGEEHECGTGLQILQEEDAGFADPVGTAEDMLEAAGRGGATVQFSAPVADVLTAGGRVQGVVTGNGGTRTEHHAPVVVNCAGPWAMALNERAGVEIPHRMVPIRAQMVLKQFPERLKGPLPMVSDLVNGIYFRLEASGQQVMVGSLREDEEREEVDPDDYNEVADASYREKQLTLLHHRVPTFHARGQVTSYSGLYTVTPDYHPIIDGTDLDGFFLVSGFSGHGFKHAPIVGALATRLVTGQWGRVASQVPLDFFRRSRPPLNTLWGGVTA